VTQPMVRSVEGAAGMFVFLLIAQTGLSRAAARAAAGKRPVVFFDVVVTGDDNRYSLSRLQAYLWTIVVALAFAGVTVGTGQFATVPRNLVLLMGVNLGAAVAATAITTSQAGKPRPAGSPAPPNPARPSFVRDLFFESGLPGSLDLPRTQMFLWTIVMLATYVVLFLQAFPAVAPSHGAAELLDVPSGMLALMGVSQATYLGAKAAR
jgi:hypothetical protein